MHLQTAVLLTAESPITPLGTRPSPLHLKLLQLTHSTARGCQGRSLRRQSAEDKENSTATIFCLFSSEEMKKSHLKGKGDKEQTRRSQAELQRQQTSLPGHTQRTALQPTALLTKEDTSAELDTLGTLSTIACFMYLSMACSIVPYDREKEKRGYSGDRARQKYTLVCSEALRKDRQLILRGQSISCPVLKAQ